MARCSYHPNVETEMRCAECGKPICPKEMVLTPVGYKCPEDARPVRSQYIVVKPKQLIFALLAGAGASLAGALLLAFVHFGGILLGLLWGSAVAEAVRRGSGGHRGGTMGAVAAVCLVMGWAFGLLLGGISEITTGIAIIVALVQLAAFGNR